MFYEGKCTLCGECLSKCYYLSYPEVKAKSEFEKLIKGEDSSVTRECVTCIRCNDICPENANPFDLISKRQEETGTFPFNKDRLVNYDMVRKIPSRITKGDPGKPVMGLALIQKARLPGVLEGQLFEGLTTLSGGDYFSWVGNVHIGRQSLVNKENVQNLVDNYAKLNVEEIIFYHEECYAVVTYFAKEFNIDVPFRPIHIYEYLKDYVKEHSDQVKKLNMKVAYHPPCSSRYVNGMDEVLDELFELIGVERVKRKYDREGALCCGSVQSAMDTVSKEEEHEWRMKNIMDAKEAGAEAFVLLCPVCIPGLRGRAKAQGMEPYILSNLVRLALGEELTHGGAAKKFD
ncbi:MAG: heterodisulfide reductase-related iron-sulfur binding cluster [Promethearchaeota archaeon]